MVRLLVFVALFVPVQLAFAAEPADWTPLPISEGLAGWRAVGGGEWTVADGVVTGRAGKDVNSWLLFADREFADFEVEFDFRTPKPVNGGVQMRSHWLPQAPVADGANIEELPHLMYGYQANIETRQRTATGRIIDENGRGPLAEPTTDAANALIQKKLLTQTGWNKMRVVARGPVLETYLADQLMCRVEDEAYLSGYFALQVYHMDFAGETAEVQYRNIRIKDFGREGNWRPLFTGTNLDGWQTYGEESWTVEDGVIVGRSGPKKSEGYLATQAQWEDFHVRAAFKMLGDGNFGLFYHATITLREDGYPVIAGIQAEVEPKYPTASGCLYESYKRGWLTPPDTAKVGALALRPEWNTIEVRSQGPRVTTWLNGVRVVDFTDPAPNLTKGSLALQLHTGGVDGIAWRDILLRE